MLFLRIAATLLGILTPLQISHPTSQQGTAPAASVTCPWLTEGTAASALNGNVLAAVTLTDKSQGVCTFTRLQGPRNELKIFVGGSNLPSCPRHSMPLAGVGTYANQCSVNTKPGQKIQMISGAVRERGFAISITTKALPSADPDSSVQDALRQVAEAVAGSLF